MLPPQVFTDSLASASTRCHLLLPAHSIQDKNGESSCLRHLDATAADPGEFSMRLIGLASLAFVGSLAFAISAVAPIAHGQQPSARAASERRPTGTDGQSIFRFDTFGD